MPLERDALPELAANYRHEADRLAKFSAEKSIAMTDRNSS